MLKFLVKTPIYQKSSTTKIVVLNYTTSYNNNKWVERKFLLLSWIAL